MSATVFDAGDRPFLDWMLHNPEGFVLNAASGIGNRYLWFHRTSCHHITGYTKAQSDGAFTSRGYIKVCSSNAGDLVEWAARNRIGATSYKSCKSCCPDIENLTPLLAEEVAAAGSYVEGATHEVKINAYERNPLARRACLAHHGCSCVVCGFSFEKAFGIAAKGFIHVHHLVPLSEIGTAYEIDPIKELRPVCPNCHAVIHLGGSTRTIEEVRDLLASIQTSHQTEGASK